jgi:acyl carrier protein
MDDVAERLHLLISDVLDRAPEDVTPDMKRDDIPEWDSLAHLRIVTAVEEEFGLRLTMDQIAALKSIADIQHHLERA